jgi:hypothetical protein
MEAGYRIDRPNRDKASSKSTRAVVIVLLAISVALMLIVLLGGWSTLQGAQAFQIAYVLIYLSLAVGVARWSRGALAVTAALAIILAIFAGVAGPAWFARDANGFAPPETVFGGGGPGASLLGIVTFLLIPVQMLLIAFSAQAFRQDWQVEVEVPNGPDDPTGPGPGARRGSRPSRPAAA